MEKFDSFTFQNYKILHLIGTGSFGKVFKAAEIETQNVVALKVLSKHGRSTKELSALKQEANIQQSLRHPNIIQLVTSFETDKELVFVCEYAVSDLHKLLAKVGSLGEQRTQKLSYDLISALYYLHSHRILHRDLKPPNILLDKNYKAKVCDFGLARNMTLGTQILTSIKGTPLYMAPELLEGRGYGHEADLWSLGCIIYEMLAGESPFNTRSILHLMQLIRYGNIKWPTFLTSTCISFLKGLLVNNPSKRMGWDEILDHKFVRGNVLILASDQAVSDSPFTRPKGTRSEERAQANPKKRLEVQHTEDVMSSRDSIKVNAHLPSDIEETDNETEVPPLQMDIQPRMHNLALVQPESVNVIELQSRMHTMAHMAQPLAENANMVMHRFMDNAELQQFLMMPLMMASGGGGAVQLQTSAAITPAKSTTTAVALTGSKKKNSSTPQSTTDASSVPVETEEWLQFLFKSMQEILDGDLEMYKQENLMTMIVGLLRDAKLSAKLIDHAVQIISLPYAIDMPRSMLDDIDRMYVQLKLVPNLVYASKLLCAKRGGVHEVRTLAAIYDLVVFLVYAGDTFLHMLCDAMALLNLDALFRAFIVSGIESETREAVRLTGSVLALVCAILQELPENAKLIEKVVLHEDVQLCRLLRHASAKIRLRACLMLRLLGRFCCYALQSHWSGEISSVLHNEMACDEDAEVRAAAENVIEEFRGFGWFLRR